MSLPDRPDDTPRPQIRASDQERDDVVELLSEHATSGRLTLAELEERIDRAYEATTRDELAKLTADLPAATRTPATGEPRRRKATRWIVAVMGGTSKRGRWRVAGRVNAVAIMGGHDIDLRDAELDSDETTIVSVSIMGGTDIYVPDTVDVEVGGFSLMGGTDERGSRRSPRPGAPRIRIQAYNLMGGAEVWRLPEEALGLSLKEAKKAAKRVE
ncbi:DUF1707 SHOCT-like domain-containing protein [Phytoactinopolyspora halotolerans]|uniref:DUF1707 domain-containing protein n=1 Tax=Phytoactinopolyspora halotolerans TaxID=1981512 RepID=A0A6L9S2I6_9ACTN|nr:DUF1707 domain-containing protein [Phytoactinopolyspora halotolerans]NED99425.1 DUF1707 domain-containing protein [Phytoactinopolyspora halotolerans]